MIELARRLSLEKFIIFFIFTSYLILGTQSTDLIEATYHFSL